jgi:roadblock/LC7 domain-containing protein
MSLIVVDGVAALAAYTLTEKLSKLVDIGGVMAVVEPAEHGVAIVHKGSMAKVYM